MNTAAVMTLENHACQLAVSVGGGTSARQAAAKAIRAWRKRNDRERARWLRRHLHYITGHLWKDTAAVNQLS